MICLFFSLEDMPIDMILEKLGVNSSTLHASHGINNYCRSKSFIVQMGRFLTIPLSFLAATFQPIELLLPSYHPPRRRRLVCREVSDSDDESYLRRPSDHHRRHSSGPWHNEPQNTPLSLHNVLSRVWDKAERGSRNMPSSQSAPNINSQWQAMRNSSPSPPNPGMNNMWQAMRNAPSPTPQNNQNAVNRVWQRADYASGLQSNPSSNLFNPMPPPFQNREAVQNFNAIRNLPYGVNTGPSPTPFQNREAVQNFNAMRNLPYGVNPGLSPPPFQNREAIQNFNAVRNLPFGINTPPPPNPAINNFYAARNVPGGINQPNPAVANVWNRAGYAAQQGPPMINVPPNQWRPSSPSPPMDNMWNRMMQGPSGSPYPSSPALPMDNMWNRMVQGASAPPYGPSPMGSPLRAPMNGPAPMSFASLLSQAHQRGLPYSGAM